MASGNSSFNDLVYSVVKLGMSAQEYSNAIETLHNTMIKTISTQCKEQNKQVEKIAEGLRVIGICLYDEKGEMRNFKDVVNDLAQKWDSIDCNSYTGADTGNENGSTKFLNQNVEIPVRGLRAQAGLIGETDDIDLFSNEALFKDWFTELDLTNPFLQGDTKDEK